MADVELVVVFVVGVGLGLGLAELTGMRSRLMALGRRHARAVDGVLVRGGVHHCRPPGGINPESGEEQLIVSPYRGDGVEDGDAWVCIECQATWTARAEYGYLTWFKDPEPQPGLRQ